MHEIKTEDVYEDISKDKEMFKMILSQNIMMIQTNWSLVKWKIKPVVLLLKNLLDQTEDVFLVDDNSEHEKANGANKIDVAIISLNESKMFVTFNK